MESEERTWDTKRTIVPGQEIATRRVVLKRLAELELNEEITQEELGLHYMPDGAWSSEQISSVMARCAELPALTYCTGMTPEIGPLEDLELLPTTDIGMLVRLKSIHGWTFRESSDIRKERDDAAAYFLRCLAEKRRRGSYQISPDDELVEILDTANAAATGESQDLLLGTRTIATVSETSLEMATVQSHARFQTLNNVLAALEV